MKRPFRLYTTDSLHSWTMRTIDVVILDGTQVVNTAGHPLTFQLTDGETVVTVPNSGITVNAIKRERVIGKVGVADIIETFFVPDLQMKASLEEWKQAHPNVAIVGSMIAAQAYPMIILGLVSIPGFERTAEKRVSTRKFSTF